MTTTNYIDSSALRNVLIFLALGGVRIDNYPGREAMISMIRPNDGKIVFVDVDGYDTCVAARAKAARKLESAGRFASQGIVWERDDAKAGA